MNQTIFKYEIPATDKMSIEIPADAEILCVQVDQKTDKPCIWALVYPNNPKEERFFEVFGTGDEIRNDMGIERKYIGTFQSLGGLLILHIFERIN